MRYPVVAYALRAGSDRAVGEALIYSLKERWQPVRRSVRRRCLGR